MTTPKEFHWFLSFRDPKVNKNLGGCMVIVADEDPPDVGNAAARAWELGCNPGGEVMGFTAEGSSPDVEKAVLHMPSATLYTGEQVDDLWAPFGVRARKP